MYSAELPRHPGTLWRQSSGTQFSKARPPRCCYVGACLVVSGSWGGSSLPGFRLRVWNIANPLPRSVQLTADCGESREGERERERERELYSECVSE